MGDNFGESETTTYNSNKYKSGYKTVENIDPIKKYDNPLRFRLKKYLFSGFLLGGGIGETPTEDEIKKSERERRGQSKDDRGTENGPPLESDGQNRPIKSDRAIVRNQLDQTGLPRGYTGYSNTEHRGFAENVDIEKSNEIAKNIEEQRRINKNRARPNQQQGTRPVIDQKIIDKYLKELGTTTPCPCRNNKYGRQPILESARRRWGMAGGSGIGGGRVGGGGAQHTVKSASTEAIRRGSSEIESSVEGDNKGNYASGSGGRRRSTEESGRRSDEGRGRSSGANSGQGGNKSSI